MGACSGLRSPVCPPPSCRCGLGRACTSWVAPSSIPGPWAGWLSSTSLPACLHFPCTQYLWLQSWVTLMSSRTRWTWVWASSRSWWWTGKPGVLQSTGSQELDTTERLNWLKPCYWPNDGKGRWGWILRGACVILLERRLCVTSKREWRASPS